MKSGRKVQAQRKFAQGAYVPPTSSNALDRASRVSDATNQDLHVHQSNMNTPNLLNVVTFHKIHPHAANPVVCLNRIDVQKKNDDNNSDNTLNHTGGQNPILITTTHSIAPERQHSAIESTEEESEINCSSHSLDSTISTRKRKTNEIDYNTPPTKRPRSETFTISGSLTNDDTDDDRPLKYYIKKRKMVGVKKTQSRPSKLIRPKIITRSSKYVFGLPETVAIMKKIRRRIPVPTPSIDLSPIPRKSLRNISQILSNQSTTEKRADEQAVSRDGGPDNDRPINTSKISDNSKHNTGSSIPTPKTTGERPKKKHTVRKAKKSVVVQSPPVWANNTTTASPPTTSKVLVQKVVVTASMPEATSSSSQDTVVPRPSTFEEEPQALLEPQNTQEAPLPAQPTLNVPSHVNITALPSKVQDGKQQKTGVTQLNILQRPDRRLQNFDKYDIRNWLRTMMPEGEPTKRFQSPKTPKRRMILRHVDGQNLTRPVETANPNVYDFDSDDYDAVPSPSLSGFRQATRAFTESIQHKSRILYLDPRLSSIPNHVIQIGMPEKKEWMARLVPLSEVNESNISMIQDDSLFDHMDSASGDAQTTLDDMRNQPSTSAPISLQSTKPYGNVPKAKDTIDQTYISLSQLQGSKNNSKPNKPSNNGDNGSQTSVNITIKEEQIVISDDEDLQNVLPGATTPGLRLTTTLRECSLSEQFSQVPSNKTDSEIDTQPTAISQSSARVAEQTRRSENVKFYLDPTFTSSHKSQIIEITSIGEHLHARLVPATQIDNSIPMINYLASYDQMISNDVVDRTVQNETMPDRSQEDPQISISSPSSTLSTSSRNRSNSQRSACRQASHSKINTNTNTKAKIVEAPVFYPTKDEFKDPIAYFEMMKPMLKKFGLGKVVTPPGFSPSCILDDQMRFSVVNQYIARMYSRWGHVSREMCTIRAHLATQGVVFTRAPLLDGIEVNLSKLYHVVQRHGGLKDVIQKKRWSKVAEEMGLPKGPKLERKLDQIYLKYLVPYDTLSSKERQQRMATVEQLWNNKYRRMLDRAINPLHRQKRLLGESESSEEENDYEVTGFEGALKEAEDCVVQGRNMNLASFKKIAEKMIRMRWPNSTPSTERIEAEYWNVMQMGSDHQCVYSASVDTKHGYGFRNSDLYPEGKHPWNLKMLSKNKGNVLRFLNSVPGVSTLHLGMMHSTSCLHRDPHGLPFTEYLHEGSPKIWYGIPEDQSENFRKAVETLCPSYCQNKEVWLPSDIAMIPPNQLIERNVALTRVEQNPGEFILVYPQAYSCSICTGYTVSESAYFATKHWLDNAYPIFQNLRESCEPTMFPLEQLLLSAGKDPSISSALLQRVYAPLCTIVWEELGQRRALESLGIPSQRHIERPGDKRRPPSPRSKLKLKAQQSDECEICRATLYLSHVTGITDVMSPMCIQHALRVLHSSKFKGRSLTSIDLTCFYSAAELETLLQNVERRLEGVLSSKDERPTTSTALRTTHSTRRNTTI